MLLTPRKAAEHFNVSKQTLRRWATAGKVDFIRTEKGHRRYRIEGEIDRKNYIYARVSSSKQKKDLKRQVAFLKSKYKDYTVITDVGSGANFNRKGLQQIMDQVIKNRVGTIVISYKDRLTRFGYDFLEWLCCRFGTRIRVEKNKPRNAEQELAEDLVTIITSFAARIHGSRSYTKRKDPDLPDPETEEEIE